MNKSKKKQRIWRYTKQQGVVFSKRYKEYRNKQQLSRRKAFCEAFNDRWEGYWLYDFYWWFIWSPYSVVFCGKMRDIRNIGRHWYERIKYGVSFQDIYDWEDSILDYFYYGFKRYSKFCYGDPVEIKAENEDFFIKVTNYIWLYEQYRDLSDLLFKGESDFIKNEDITNQMWQERQYQIDKLYGLLIDILTNYRERLFI